MPKQAPGFPAWPVMGFLTVGSRSMPPQDQPMVNALGLMEFQRR